MSSELPSVANSGYPLADSVVTTQSKRRTTPASGPLPPVTDDVTALTREAAQLLQVDNQNVQFSLDSGSGKVIVKVIDAATKQVLRQIPSEEMLEIAKSLDRLRGLLVNQRA
jgi:flagellar protein FlaG